MGYSTGTIAIDNGSTSVTGSGTAFNANVRAGDQLRAPDGKPYEIVSVVSDTGLTIAPAYEGTNTSGASYLIMQTGSGIRDLAASTAELVQEFADVRDQAGQGMFGDGSLSAPGMRFLADQDTGFRRTGTNAMALTLGGSDLIAFGTSGISVGGTLNRFTGDLAVNYSGTPGVNVIAKNIPNNAGGSVFTVQGIAGGLGQAVTATFSAVTGTGWSATAAAAYFNKDNGTNRSLNAAGTVNASGADPAEYHYKADGCPTIAKGQVVGIDANDRITMVWADAIDFAIKSTDPSSVGGDRWGSAENILAVYGLEHYGNAPVLPEEPSAEEITAHAAALTAWNAAKAAYDTALETERAKVDRLSHGGGRLPCIVSGEVVAGQYVIAQDDGDGGIEAVCAATVADEDRWRIVGRVRIAEPTEAQIRMLIGDTIAINPDWTAIVVQMKG